MRRPMDSRRAITRSTDRRGRRCMPRRRRGRSCTGRRTGAASTRCPRSGGVSTFTIHTRYSQCNISCSPATQDPTHARTVTAMGAIFILTFGEAPSPLTPLPFPEPRLLVAAQEPPQSRQAPRRQRGSRRRAPRPQGMMGRCLRLALHASPSRRAVEARV